MVKNTMVAVMVKKCRCYKVWCPECQWIYRKKFQRRLKTFKYTQTRHVILTTKSNEKITNNVDREELYRRSSKDVAYFIKELQRTEGLKINRYIKIVEWHTDGFPHYHVMIEMEKSGIKSKIGHDIIQKYWKHGSIVWERYYSNKREWDEFTGYFNKCGYLEKESGHQNNLPEWAMDSTCIIRKFHYSRYDWGDNDQVKEVKEEMKNQYLEDKQKRNIIKKTNRERLAECGAKSRLSVYDYENEKIQNEMVNYPYKFFKNNKELRYIEGMGLMWYLPKKLFIDFINKNIYDAPLFLEERYEQGQINWDMYINHYRY